ncbi:MAG: 30S ribosome-binding factor RbfA [Deltaproteobacteria bacterium]|nr:30S ribosome-binding factor RbfA [Deltaproteobacteria bacterium]
MANRRQQRVSSTIRQVLASKLLTDIRDPRIRSAGVISIASVQVSADLTHAKVYLSMSVQDPRKRKKTIDGLNSAAAFLRGEVGRVLSLKRTPELSFLLDETEDRARQLEQIMKEIARERQADPPRAVVDVVTQGHLFLVTSHKNPDGDAIGCLLGMGRILELMDKDFVLYAPDGIPSFYQSLHLADQTVSSIEGQPFDATIVLDTADPSLLGPDYPPSHPGTIVVMDHHMSYKAMGDITWRDRNASAAGCLIYELARRLGIDSDQDLGQCLWSAIYTDTGGFRYSSTNAEALRISADLIDWGVNPWKMATAIFESNPPTRITLLSKALATLELTASNRVASITITRRMLEEAHLDNSMLDTFINHPRSIKGVEIAIQFSEREAGWKISLRSKGSLDVSALAEQFGGGGHRNAAGCFIASEYDEVHSAILDAASQLVGSEHSEP